MTLGGLLIGVGAGALAMLFTKLKVWKLAVAMGSAGGAAAVLMFPSQFMPTALVRFDGPDGWSGMREVFSAATREESLAVIALNSGVTPANPENWGTSSRPADGGTGCEGSCDFICRFRS